MFLSHRNSWKLDLNKLAFGKVEIFVIKVYRDVLLNLISHVTNEPVCRALVSKTFMTLAVPAYPLTYVPPSVCISKS